MQEYFEKLSVDLLNIHYYYYHNYRFYSSKLSVKTSFICCQKFYPKFLAFNVTDIPVAADKQLGSRRASSKASFEVLIRCTVCLYLT